MVLGLAAGGLILGAVPAGFLAAAYYTGPAAACGVALTGLILGHLAAYAALCVHQDVWRLLGLTAAVAVAVATSAVWAVASLADIL